MGDGESDPVRICWVPGAHEGDIATALAVGHERLAVVETIPDDVSRLLAGDSIDGIVCGQDLDGVTGTALLAAIRDEFPDLPVILYPHDAGRAVASDAVSLGVTEYLPGGQEGVAPDAVADRIVDAVDDRRRDRTFAAHEKRYQSMLDTVGDVVYTLDRDGKITSANDAAIETIGYEREGLLGEHVSSVISPDDVAAGEQVIQRLLTGDDERETVEMDLHTADGDVIPCENNISIRTDSDSSFVGTVGVLRDISERKRRERVLQSLHDATREMMAAETPERVAELASETASDVLELPINGVFLYDENRDALISRAASPVAQRLFELPFELERGAGIAWEVYQTGEPRWFADVRTADAVYNPETPVRSEIVLPLDDHGVVTVGSTDVGAIEDSDLPLAKVLAANTSAALTAAKREQTLRERERMLERQNEQLEEFAGVVSHDLRNPLDVAQGRVELFLETGEADHIRNVAAAHERMVEIIDDVLTMARRGQTVSALDPVDVSAVSEDAWSNVATAEAQLTIADPPVIEADETRLKHLLENLFRNAIEHGGTESQLADAALGDGGTTVCLTVGEIAADGRTDGFYVADDGPGIPPGEREEIFASGYSTAESGTGFGLAIVDQIVTAHGWSIDVTRSDDGGARFEITDVRLP